MTGLGMPIEGSPGREGPAAAQQHTEKPTPVILMTKPPAPNHASRRRSCEPCRVRKLKCDGTRPICGKCGKRPGMQCIYLGKQKDNSHDPPASLDTIREMVAGNPMSIEGWQMGPEGEVMLKSASGKRITLRKSKH
ncbi:hypothetical protein BC829DRAFT_251500 [Chytridium lagenaria]|nr:hypothetical protein BC829DRAFT_251500 [Chytridium lagenaria]